MKRKIGIILCLIMTLMLSLTGCASEKDKILGTWIGTFDLTEALNVYTAEDEELGKYLVFEDFSLEMTMTFNEDDTYTLTADESKIAEMMNSLLIQMEAGLRLYFEDILKTEGYDMEVDDFLALAGISLNDLLGQMLTEDMISEMVDDIAQSGKFVVEDGKLYLSEDLNTNVDKSLYELYHIEDDVLTIEAGTASGGDDMTKYIYPMVLQKVN